MNGCVARHHLDVAHVRDRALAHRDVEHLEVFVLQRRRADDRGVLVDVRLDLGDLGVVVAEVPKRERHRAVDDRHLTAADELLELDQREVGLDARRVAVHEERDRPGRSEHRRLGVAVAVLLAELDRLVPAAPGCVEELGVDLLLQLVRRVAVHPHDLVVRLAVLGVRVVRADRGGHLGRLAVAAARHERRDRGCDRAALVGVVRQAVRHEVGAEVRVAQAELAERAAFSPIFSVG